MVLLYLWVVFVNSPEVSILEKALFKAPDNFSPHDFSSHFKCCYCKMKHKHWAGNRSIYFLDQKTKKCGGLEQLLMCMFSDNDVI